MPSNNSIQKPSTEEIVGLAPAADKAATAATSATEGAATAGPSAAPGTAATPTLLAALDANPGSTVAELAEAAKISRSAAFKRLVTLEQAGLASRHLGALDGVKRMPDRWQAGALSVAEPEAAEPVSAPDGQAEAMEEPTAGDGRKPEPTATSDVASSPADAAVSKPSAKQAVGEKARLGAGELRNKVLDHLRDHAQEELTPFVLGKLLGHSSGAVANACEKLATDGAIVQTSERPRRYRIGA